MAEFRKPKYIETPDAMYELFEKYVVSIKRKPILVQDFVGKDGDEVNRKKERPLTHEGFRTFGHKNGVSIEPYMANSEKAYGEYLTICSRIKDEIRQDQIEGGMAGIYNPSITQRLNGLVDKTQTEISVEQGLFPDVKSIEPGNENHFIES